MSSFLPESSNIVANIGLGDLPVLPHQSPASLSASKLEKGGQGYRFFFGGGEGDICDFWSIFYLIYITIEISYIFVVIYRIKNDKGAQWTSISP